ncbi:2,3-bisphosphoglycerate-independent phosphoglycerate mutase [Desulfovibrio sp. OttesenSCG-928-C06]|nr:2,3-bisphosphoglycerate-independent phosphoglycerate mutase [Desulfovibrio sp. OttesenSCG-928-C06]
MKIKPTILTILDGWGLAPAGPGNATSLADTPTLDKVLAAPIRTDLKCSGRAVGLPDGFMGNSEVGHMNIGAGRIVYQDMTRIDVALEDGSINKNPVLLELLGKAKAAGGNIHFMGLLSDGGVHSHIRHLFALLKLAKEYGIAAYVHAFMDGRDTSPTSGAGYVRDLLAEMQRIGHGSIASLVGRYYAMDRDKRWDRTAQAWNMLVHEQGQEVADPVKALEAAYAVGETDEFVKPRLVTGPGGKKAVIGDNDAVFFFNFRADRARELTSCFFSDDFTEFERGKRPVLSGFATMTQYDEQMPVPAAFGPETLSMVLGEVVSNLGLKQLRIAETEKYAHVTYFFNGGREDVFPGEDRQLIPSPRDVATYDLKPQMSAVQVKDTMLAEWEKHRYSLVVCNFANPDMVGHTGIIPAAVTALETVDKCVAELWDFARKNGCRLIITADHGNAEEMLTPDNKPMTAHTLNKVPFVILDDELDIRLKADGKLGDIAPTILDLWEVPRPEEMTGLSLIDK